MLRIGAGVLLALVLAPAPAHAGPDLDPPVPIRPRPGRVALTFDDGPNPTWTPLILDILDEYGVKATFFVNGFRVDTYPEIAAEVVRRGHSLQNHTFGHPRLPDLSDYGILREVQRGADSIRAATGVESACLRPPWGLTTGRVRRIAASAGHRIVLWSVESRDYAHQSGAGNIREILEEVEVKSGDVILLHDSIGWAARDSLPTIITVLRERGFEFDTICLPRTASQDTRTGIDRRRTGAPGIE